MPQYQLGDVDVPLKYRDPLTGKIMENPVEVGGHIFEKESIEKFQKKYGNISPFTRKPISFELRPCNELKDEIQKFLSNQNRKKLNLFVKKLEGQHYCITMYEDDTIYQLKSEITLRSNIPEEQLVLNYQGKILDCDISKLKNYNIQNDSIINLTLRLRGG